MFAFRMIVIYYFRSGDTLVDFEESGAPLHKAWSDGLNRDARLSVDKRAHGAGRSSLGQRAAGGIQTTLPGEQGRCIHSAVNGRLNDRFATRRTRHV